MYIVNNRLTDSVHSVFFHDKRIAHSNTLLQAILSAKASAAYICMALSTKLSKVACSTDTNQSNRSGYTLIVKEVSKTYVTSDDNLEDI